ncbi:MAG: membrane protein insertion efficiency factor YidD [Oscillospiraceae bacterium]|nr:membrane protein insertion efficiency factor YidD [Oscillospiraceae bacterium]
MKKILVGTIKFYQRFISPLKRPSCRFYPSCSQYAILSVQKYGAFKGVGKAIWRILRCNPWNDGGVDFP